MIAFLRLVALAMVALAILARRDSRRGGRGLWTAQQSRVWSWEFLAVAIVLVVGTALR